MIDDYSSAISILAINRYSHRGLIASISLLCLLASCSAPAKFWDGQVHQWGTMREVLAEGKSQSRILLKHLQHQHELIGVGALEGLAGEITICQGHIWLAKGEMTAVEAANESATLLAIARVTQWSTMRKEAGVSVDQLESIVREAANQSGIDTSKPFPFVIEGRLTVDAHVIRGACPHAGAASAPQPPITFSMKDEPGTLVGFFAENSEGTLTHHGSRIHAHVLTKDQPPRMGHVDSAAVGPESIISLPSRK